MKGDKLLIRTYHTRAAKAISKSIIHEVFSSYSRYTIAIGGESGSGKSETAWELAKILNKKGFKTVIIQQDDYFKRPPKTNREFRYTHIGSVGPGEVKLNLLNQHVKKIKDANIRKLHKPLVSFDKDLIGEEILHLSGIRAVIIEGTYTNILKNVDKKIFLSRTYKETKHSRAARKRDKIDKYTEKILSIEHKIISGHKKLADIIVNKDFSITIKKEPERKVKKICVLSVHGYVDAKPILGKTDTGGQVTYVLELSKAMAKKGCKVDLYTRKFGNKKRIEQVSKNVRIIRIPCNGSKFIPKEKLFPYLDTFVNNMERFIKKEGLRYDIFHSHYWDAGYVAMKLTERLDYFFIHTFHSLGSWKKEQMGGDPKRMEQLYYFKRRMRWEKAIFKKTEALVMTSTEMITRARRFYNYIKKNYIVLPAGVNMNFFRPLKKGEKYRKIDVPQNYIFWVGRFASNKGLDYLLRAFAETVKKEKDLFLVLGGGSKEPQEEEKEIKRELKNIIDRYKIQNRVYFTRHIKDEHIPSYYRQANFFVLSSKFEPFGMTAAEAMASGCPVIVSRRAGIRKYLKNKVNCLLVNPSNKKDLSWAFRVLNRNRNFREKIRKNGLKLARSEFGWTKIAARSLNFYEKHFEDFLESI